jgi:DNA-binding protein H-NS
MTTTTVERLTRIETLLEAAVGQRAEDRADMNRTIAAMATDIKAIRTDLDADKAALAEMTNRGRGLLIGVSLAAGALGAYAEKLADKLFG